MSHISDAYRRWQDHCRTIQEKTSINISETPAVRQARIERARKDYDYFVQYYFPHYATAPCADFHLKAARLIISNPILQTTQKWARGHAKSTHFGLFIPLWLKIQKTRQINVMLLSSKSKDAACRLLGDLQAELVSNQRYIHDFGEQHNHGNWEDGKFITRDGVMFLALGREQSPRGIKERGARPDYILIDDIDDDELVQNPKRVDAVVDWCVEALGGTMDMWRGRFIAVGNLIAKNSVLEGLSKLQGMNVQQVNALDKNGNPSWKSKYTRAEIDKVREIMGERRFQKEFMNNPVISGKVFKIEWIRYKKLPKLNKYDHLVLYIDPSFKDKSDFKAARLWGKIGNELHLINCFVRQASVSAMVKWVYDVHEKCPTDAIINYYMEANFMQDILLDEFTEEGNLRGYQLPIVGDMRKKPDKFQRIEGVSPLWERGFVYYNEDLKDNPDHVAGLEQTLAIQKGSRFPDDAPDADEGAIWKLQFKTRSEAWAPSLGIRKRKTGW
jgi:phage terminase large subunit-like protein